MDTACCVDAGLSCDCHQQRHHHAGYRSGVTPSMARPLSDTSLLRWWRSLPQTGSSGVPASFALGSTQLHMDNDATTGAGGNKDIRLCMDEAGCGMKGPRH